VSNAGDDEMPYVASPEWSSEKNEVVAVDQFGLVDVSQDRLDLG
jgi:hypothetical protein